MSQRKAATAGRIGKTERWLNLLAFLCDRRFPVSREEILSQVDDYRTGWVGGDDTGRESVRRKFERDKRELKELGIAIVPQRQRVDSDHSDSEVEAYLLRQRDLYLPYLDLVSDARHHRPYHLPSLVLQPGELAILRRAADRVLALGPTSLGASAASAVRKLSFDLPLGPRAGKETVLTPPIHPTFEQRFAVLREGTERRIAVRCQYYAIGRDAEEERVIHPYGVMLSWGIWYCIAYAPEREAIRVFRIDRMRSAALMTGTDAGFTVPPGFSVQAYLDRAPWELTETPPIEVRIRIAFPHARWVLAEGIGRVEQAVDAEGGAVLAFGVRSRDAFVRWLLPFGDQVQVLDPPEMRARLASERDRVRALYA